MAPGDSIDSNSSMQFWVFLDQLLVAKPFNPRTFESILHVPLRRTDRNQFFEYFSSGKAEVQGIAIDKAELRTKQGSPNIGLISLEISGPCISVGEVKQRFHDLSVTLPGGDSPNEMIYFSAALAWGKLSFGFSQMHSNCLTRIVLDSIG
jgi:hypothetical protein